MWSRRRSRRASDRRATDPPREPAKRPFAAAIVSALVWRRSQHLDADNRRTTAPTASARLGTRPPSSLPMRNTTARGQRPATAVVPLATRRAARQAWKSCRSSQSSPPASHLDAPRRSGLVDRLAHTLGHREPHIEPRTTPKVDWTGIHKVAIIDAGWPPPPDSRTTSPSLSRRVRVPA